MDRELVREVDREVAREVDREGDREVGRASRRATTIIIAISIIRRSSLKASCYPPV